ncbi:hypothetical protein [Stomatohabitans albus]
MPIILIGSLLMVSPLMGAFINGVIDLPDFLLRYLLALLFCTLAVWIISTVYEGYQRANDYAAKAEMQRLRIEEAERAAEQARIERKAQIEEIAKEIDSKHLETNE